MKKYRNFYLISLGIIIAASIYPIYMGVVALAEYFSEGFIEQANYPKYLIPYAPMCIAIIVAAALMPLTIKLFKRFSLAVTSVIGVGGFILAEKFFEQIKVVVRYETLRVDGWQLSLCMATPEVLEAQGKPIYAENNPTFKVHFYIIAIVIILSVLALLYGYSKLFLENKKELKKPLLAQTVSVILFIGLCILACFTAFFRNGTLYISPLSSLLTAFFFIVFGITFGIYICSFFIGKGKICVWISALTASLTTLIMYIGELLLMGGKLFIFGKGFFFLPLGIIPFSPCDIVVILVSGIITAIIAKLINKEKVSLS
ncbi:MAG: hypothetical protein E7671_05825 [Ruminococcaceae bacterium]|nr:hypothetical protein [Oscillospiraceae bacterium]